MAMPMRLHRGVLGQGKPPLPIASERPFLPRLKDGGILARFGELHWQARPKRSG